MQAIILCEVYSIYKSRRPPLQFSKTFEDVYRNLSEDAEALNPETASPFNDSSMQTATAPPDEYSEYQAAGMVLNQDAKCKQRMLIACYILDQQHAILFGRQRTSCLSLLGMNLPFSRSQRYWDASPEEQAEVRYRRQSSGVPRYDQVYEAMSAVPSLTETAEDPHDAFRSLLLMACLTDTNHDPQALGFVSDNSPDLSPVLFAVEQTQRMRLAFHTFMLCKHTPVRDLLAVAGESWCMAEKLSSQNDYESAQVEALHWARAFTEPGFGFASDKEPSSVEHALYHARQILDIHNHHPRTGLLFQQWSIYLASVVVWARAYAIGIEPRQEPSPPIPNTNNSPVSTRELKQTVMAFVRSEPTVTLTWSIARNILLWSKTKIEEVDIQHNCGLTNGALDVLGKLVSRGNEQGWFGDV